MTMPASAAGTPGGRPSLRVLVPVDGSPGSDCAVRYVVELARRSRPVEVLVLNVEPSLTYIETLVSPAQMLADYWSDSAGKQAARSACALLDAAGVSYSLHLVRGDPREAIGAFARQFECDLIVMGTRGMGGAANLVLGSVAAGVIQCADRPITLVKQAAQRMT